ncbi:MAG: Sua5/YciO/YrdC/YwlC family protein, partial [Propionibacteriaceae bacterium]
MERVSQRFDTATQTEAALSAAVAAVEAGECIVLPTDTVYGIGADAFSSTAVQGLLDAKQRGRDMPPPVLLSDAAVLESLAANIDPRVWLLAEAFWP